MTNSYPSGSPGVPDSSMPTGAPGSVFRRSSYASVVSGAAPYQQPARSGAFSHLLNQNADFGYDPSYQNMSGHQRYDPRYDMDYNPSGSSHGRSGSWGRGGQLHPFSSAFAGVMNGNGYGGFGAGSADQFFIPSYLKGSRYVQRLEEAHKAKIAAQKDSQSAPSSQPGSLSTSASSINLHSKMAPSYRGITHDVIEKAPPTEDETLTPLPSKWNNLDKYGGLEVLNDGLEVKFSGPKSERDRDHEACAIRADHPMPSQCGIYYFEVDIVSRKREESSIGIGFSTKDVPLSRLPGWEPNSYAYHGDDGHSFCCQSSGKHYGPPFNAGDVIGCGVNFRTGCAFFTKNGDDLGIAFRDIKESKGKLFPSVGMKKAGEHIRVNFGQRPFVFDIDSMMSASNTFSYPQSSSPSDVPSPTSDSQENGADAAGRPGLSLENANTASFGEHLSPEEHVRPNSTDRSHDDRVIDTNTASSPSHEERLGPFNTYDEARAEGRRRQREMNRNFLFPHEPRSYITLNTSRSRGGYKTTLYTWFHPPEPTDLTSSSSPPPLIPIEDPVTALPTPPISERRASISNTVDEHASALPNIPTGQHTYTLNPAERSSSDLDNVQVRARAALAELDSRPPSRGGFSLPFRRYLMRIDQVATRPSAGPAFNDASPSVSTNQQTNSTESNFGTYMAAVENARRERRPTLTYQEFLAESQRIESFLARSNRLPTTAHSRHATRSRSPRQPPSNISGNPDTQNFSSRAGRRPRGRGQIARSRSRSQQSRERRFSLANRMTALADLIRADLDEVAEGVVRGSTVVGFPVDMHATQTATIAFQAQLDQEASELDDQRVTHSAPQSFQVPTRGGELRMRRIAPGQNPFRTPTNNELAPRSPNTVNQPNSDAFSSESQELSQAQETIGTVPQIQPEQEAFELNAQRVIHSSVPRIFQFLGASHRHTRLQTPVVVTQGEILMRRIDYDQMIARRTASDQNALQASTSSEQVTRSPITVNQPNSDAVSSGLQERSVEQDITPGSHDVFISIARMPDVIESNNAQIALLRAQSGRLSQGWISREISKLMWTGIRANHKQRERKQIRQEIEATSTAKLAPPMDETELIQALILQALAHDGYVETARAFAEEVHAEKKALSLDPNEVVKGFDVKEDEDAGHRQRIRTAVLEGDVEKALKYTNAYYPNVLKDNEHVYFRLRCRKFIEMVRQAAELQHADSKPAKKSNGHNGDWYDDIINHDMELDDHPNSNNYDRMDTEELSENQSEHLRLLQDTLVYGAELQAEFKDDPRREVKKGLDDIFALMAYQDPLNEKGVSHLLESGGRMAVAEELNSAILLSLGKSSSAALERLYQQTYVLLEDLREGGGAGSLVNIDDFVRSKSERST